MSAPTRTADLVLEGGGVKGTALVGAVTAFTEAGYRFNRVAGTSAGALVAALVTAGLPVDYLRDRFLSLDYARLLDRVSPGRHLGRVGNALAELVSEGIYHGDALRDVVAEELAHAHVTTFADLRLDDPGLDDTVPDDSRYRLVVVGSDITRQRMVRIPWDLREDYGIDPATMHVADAVRISSAIPFFYLPYRLRSAITGQESLMVDGGLVSGFPVSIFDRNDGRAARWPTFRIALHTAVPARQRVAEITGRVSLLRAVVDTGLHGRLNTECDDTSITSRTVWIETSYANTTDFAIDRATRQRLFDDGHRAASEFLARWDAASAGEQVLDEQAEQLGARREV